MTANIDAFTQCTARFGEIQSGDAARLFYGEDTVTAVLACSGGNTMRACVLSGMVVGMFDSVLSHPVTVDEAVATVINMLPAGDAAESAGFMVAQMRTDGSAYLARLAMPAPVLLRRGHVRVVSPAQKHEGFCVYEETRLQLKPRDTLVCFGSGIAQAGDGVPYAAGWSGTLLPAYLEAAYQPSVPACKIGELLLNVSSSLYGGKPKRDLSIAVLRYHARRGDDDAVL